MLKLVHLSNGFKMIPGSRPLKAEDVCRDSDETVRVSGHALCEGYPVIEFQSVFFFRGRFTDYENTLEVIDEPEYTVEHITDADVGVLMFENLV